MKKKGMLLVLAFLLFAYGCSASKATSENEKTYAEVELTVNNTVMGTVFGQNIYYTGFHPYLLVTDNINERMVREELALNYMLEQELAAEGITYTEEEFESFAADQYYKECLFEPDRIDEIETVRSVIGFFKDAMDLALYEGYRQPFFLNCLGDHYAEQYRAANPQGALNDEEYEAAAVEAANEKLRAFVSGLSGKYILGTGKTLMTVNGKEILLEERHNCYIVFTVARERIRIVDDILKGCGMAYEMQQNGFSGTTEIDTEIEKYIDRMRKDTSFYETYKAQFEKDAVSYEQFLLSLRFVLQMQNSAPALYETYLSGKYEALTENKPATYDEYKEQQLAILYGSCVPVNVMN